MIKRNYSRKFLSPPPPPQPLLRPMRFQDPDLHYNHCNLFYGTLTLMIDFLQIDTNTPCRKHLYETHVDESPYRMALLGGNPCQVF